ncbi:MAG: NYN domain-containing protein [Bacteroidota bacterium]|nr:NYN domain-containing protein [Bacteroidota bacterium]MDE2957706.1 NYN domain-containing protein [Bacteroidota bacterium]
MYWDNSSLFPEAQRQAEGRREGPDARYRVRLHFENLFILAHAERHVERAFAVGSIPPEMRKLWNRMEGDGIEVELFDRGKAHRGEQDMPDGLLQLRMLEDALDYSGDPEIAVLLSGDGAGYLTGAGFHSTLERMLRKGWRIEILSWAHSCNQRMRRWAMKHGVFVPLDDHYEAITFLEPARGGHLFAPARNAAPLNLNQRAIS